MFVYMLRHRIFRDVFYIGSTNDLSVRMKDHRYSCMGENARDRDLKCYEMMREYGGWYCFDWLIIDIVTSDDRAVRNERERAYILEMKPPMNTFDCTYNDRDYNNKWAEYRQTARALRKIEL